MIGQHGRVNYPGNEPHQLTGHVVEIAKGPEIRVELDHPTQIDGWDDVTHVWVAMHRFTKDRDD